MVRYVMLNILASNGTLRLFAVDVILLQLVVFVTYDVKCLFCRTVPLKIAISMGRIDILIITSMVSTII